MDCLRLSFFRLFVFELRVRLILTMENLSSMVLKSVLYLDSSLRSVSLRWFSLSLSPKINDNDHAKQETTVMRDISVYLEEK